MIKTSSTQWLGRPRRFSPNDDLARKLRIFSSLVSQQSQLQHSRGLTKITTKISVQPLNPKLRRTTLLRVEHQPRKRNLRNHRRPAPPRLASSAWR
jgi:hypothetical protein